MIKRDSAKDFAIFKTPSQYQSEYNNGPHVDDETICFVSDTGKIYTHGHEFGGNGATYTGEGGININSSNVISIDTNWLGQQIQNRINNITPVDSSIQLATSEKIGGIKIGYTDNGKNYKVQLDSNGRAFVNVPWSSTVINPDDPNSQYYDDLEDRLNTLQGLIDGLRSDLDGIHQTSEQDIEQMIKNILILINWLKQNFPIGELFHFDDWSDELEAYLKGVGVLNEDGTGAWSLLTQRLDDISAQVLAIQHSIGENGEIDLVTLQSNLQAYIDDQIAGLDLSNRYAVQNENLEVIKWMTSGFRSQAGKQEGEEGYYVDFAQMYADAFDGVNDATAAVTTKINFVEGKITSAEALMGTSFNDWIAGVVTQSNKDSAVAALFAEDAESNSKAAMMATVKNDQSFLDLVADRVTVDADITTIRGYLEAGDATFKGTVKADNLYRNVCFCAHGISSIGPETASVAYSSSMYQYVEVDPTSLFVNGKLYTDQQIRAITESGGTTDDGDSLSNWYAVNANLFIRCVGNADVIYVESIVDRDPKNGDEVVVLPDPEFHQGKFIEVYSTNKYNNVYDRPFSFRIGSVSGGRMMDGMYTAAQDGSGGFVGSSTENYLTCQHGIQYRFIATTVNGNPVWIKFPASGQWFKEIGFDWNTYLFVDSNNHLKFHTPEGGEYFVSLSLQSPNYGTN